MCFYGQTPLAIGFPTQEDIGCTLTWQEMCALEATVAQGTMLANDEPPVPRSMTELMPTTTDPPDLHLAPSDSGWRVQLRERAVGTFTAPPAVGATAACADRDGGRLCVSWEGSGWLVTDRAWVDGIAGIRIDRKVRNTASESRSLALDLTFDRAGAVDTTLIPGVQYQGNRWGSGGEPNGYVKDGLPWRFAASRTTVPGATIVSAKGLATALFVPTTDAVPLSASCSLEPRQDSCRQTLLWPAGEGPVAYTSVDSYSSAWESELLVQPGQSFTFHAYLAIADDRPDRQGWHQTLRQAWRLLGSEVVPWHSPDEIRQLCRRYVLEHLVAREVDATLFSIGLRLIDGQWVQRKTDRYEIGWCGQNGSLAGSMLEWSLETGREDLWRLGQDVLDSWLRVGKFPSGLMATRLDPILDGKPVESLDTGNLGWAVTQYVRAYELSVTAGRPKEAWRQNALDICNCFLGDPLANDRFPSRVSPEGDLVEAVGTMGAFLVPGMVQAAKFAPGPGYLERAQTAFWAYVNEDLRNLECAGGAPIGTPSVDMESAIPLLKGALLLFEATHEPRYLRAAEEAGYYLATWMYHHDVPFPEDTVLGRMDYCTRGGTGVSAVYQHIDPYAATVAADLLQLASLTGDRYWREVGLAMWNQSTIGVWDGRPCPDGIERPIGSQDEAWCQTAWGFTPEQQGATSKWLVAWPAAFHIEEAGRVAAFY